MRTQILLMMAGGLAWAGELDPSQQEWFEKYTRQANAPKPGEMLLNTDAEPGLTEGFISLLGDDLSDWESKGGKSTFELKDGVLTGTCVPGEASTYLCTKKTDYRDFIFTCEMKWEVDLNSGVMFRAQSDEKRAVFGPQVEMEGIKNTRGWSGGVYGQSCGGYWYPLWLKEHAEVRDSLDKEGWNRVTVMAKGNVVKTWLNGVPAAHWVGDGTYQKGYFGLQVHRAKNGKVLWREMKVKELGDETTRLQELDAYWAEVSRCVKEGDFEGYAATCHDDGVLVSGKRERSYLLKEALAGWKDDFDQTKSGNLDVDVEFRFGKRRGSEKTAHEVGMFRYEIRNAKSVAYIHLEALLVKKDRWLILMENQVGEGTKEEWDELR